MTEYFKCYECDCGHIIKIRGVDLSDGPIEIYPHDFAQTTFECDSCDKQYVIGDVDVHDADDL